MRLIACSHDIQVGRFAGPPCNNMPAFLAGGGFRHGQHLAFDPKNPPPLSNIYVTMLQRLGIETD